MHSPLPSLGHLPRPGTERASHTLRHFRFLRCNVASMPSPLAAASAFRAAQSKWSGLAHGMTQRWNRQPHTTSGTKSGAMLSFPPAPLRVYAYREIHAIQTHVFHQQLSSYCGNSGHFHSLSVVVFKYMRFCCDDRAYMRMRASAVCGCAYVKEASFTFICTPSTCTTSKPMLLVRTCVLCCRECHHLCCVGPLRAQLRLNHPTFRHG